MQQVLYKRSKTGKIQEWTIETEGDRFRTIEGFVDGQKTPTEWTICTPKNIGSSNETNGEQQAIKEAEARIVKQNKKGWIEDITCVDDAVQKIKPMLAQKWEDHKDRLLSLDKIASQPKLDGIRCIATREGLFTRTGEQIVSVPHIEEIVKFIFDSLDDTSFHLDGELYNHELKDDFNSIASIVRKKKLTEDDLQKSRDLIQYHVYDIDVKEDDYGNTKFDFPFASRLNLLLNISQLVLAKRPTTYLQFVNTGILNINGIDEMYSIYLEHGYEGQMLRPVDSIYENSRSKFLIKRKEFMDEEFVIADVLEGIGNRSGMMGKMVVKLPNGETCETNARGTHDYFRELLLNKSNYIGKKATVRFQNYTPDGSLRFPVMTAIRDYE